VIGGEEDWNAVTLAMYWEAISGPLRQYSDDYGKDDG
jgi:hypothetical protein